MNKDASLGTMLRDAVGRELGPELARPPRQAAQDYAPPDYRQSDDEIDPIVRGLLTHLPAAGSVWPEQARKLWLDLLEGTFRMIYRETETTPIIVRTE